MFVYYPTCRMCDCECKMCDLAILFDYHLVFPQEMNFVLVKLRYQEYFQWSGLWVRKLWYLT